MASIVVLDGVSLPQPVDIPHLAYPFTILAGGAVVVQQDTVEEITACVRVICDYVVGERDDNPTFGIPSPLFATAPLDVSGIHDAIQGLEPRASLTISESGSRTDESDRTITITVAANA